MCAIFLTSAFATALAWGAAPKTEVQDQLKSSVTEAQNKLGALKSWQKKIFDEEVVTDYQRFIRDYRTVGNTTTVEVDLQGISRYLLFYAPDVFQKPEGKAADLKVMVRILSDDDCAKCAATLPAIRKMIQTRLLRRGLSAAWSASEDASPRKADLPGLMTELPRTGNAVAAVIVQVKQVVDAEHADDEHYAIDLMMGVVGGGKSEKHLDVLKNDSLETAATRLMVEVLADLGAQHTAAQLGEVGSSNGSAASNPYNEFEVLISGFRDYPGMLQYKTAVAEALQGAGAGQNLVEERRLSRRQVVFAVTTKKSIEEVRKTLAGIPSKSLKVEVK